MLLKLCATGTLLLQAFQGKGAVKRLYIFSFMRMGLYETDKKEGKSPTFYVITILRQKSLEICEESALQVLEYNCDIAGA